MSTRTRNSVVFCFSDTDQVVGWGINAFQRENAVADQEADAIMTRSNNSFSDLQHYLELCAQPDCVKVRISRVRCRHNQYFMGLQVSYQSTFANGTTQQSQAPEHFFSHGYYAYTGNQIVDRSLELQDDEFITGLYVNQGEIVDGVTFVTNLREEHVLFGGEGGSRVTMMLPGSALPTYRIIAFTGTERGVMHRIGFFAENISWETIRPLVMLRWLVERERAAPLLLSDSECTNDHLVVRALVGAGASESLPNEIFKSVLEFLL
jgi:hypothetical protein